MKYFLWLTALVLLMSNTSCSKKEESAPRPEPGQTEAAPETRYGKAMKAAMSNGSTSTILPPVNGGNCETPIINATIFNVHSWMEKSMPPAKTEGKRGIRRDRGRRG